MSPVQQRQVAAFFARIESRILAESNLASSPGIRSTARAAAHRRASDLRQDLDYLRASYSSATVMVGEGDGR